MKQRLELTWVGKGQEDILEPRILIENPEYSYGDPDTGNLLIHGDNLLALKSLVASGYAGKVKCIYIDPPYNTGSAFEHYDDNLEHSIWLSLMKQRLELLKELLGEDGVLCCHIDDSEGHYLKVLLDEVFNRENYLTTFYVRVRYADKTLKQDMDYHKEVEYIHVFQKTNKVSPNKPVKPYEYQAFNRYFIEGEISRTIQLGGKTVEVFERGQWNVEVREGSAEGRKEIWASGTILDGNSSGRFFRDYLTGRYTEDGYGTLYKVYGIGDDQFEYRYFTGPNRVGAEKGKYYQGVPKDKLLENENRVSYAPISNFYDLAGAFGNCRNEGGVDFRSGKKPEILISTLLGYFSSPGDLVLDSFLGSGTTAAVAHKMGRRYIGIELGDHAYTHCVPRLQKVIDGTDKGGITASAGWQGGGGYRFYVLAPTLLNEDEHGVMIISPDYNAEMLAAAMALHEGFRYAPDAEVFWKQGHSSESDYIYTTTRHLTMETLEYIDSLLGEGETLLVCCTSHTTGLSNHFPRITVKRIPRMLLGRCAFDPEKSYDLNIITLPEVESQDDCDDEE